MPHIPDKMIPHLREGMRKMKNAPEPDPVATERKLMNFAGAVMKSLTRSGTACETVSFAGFEAALLTPASVSCSGVVLYLHGGGYCTGDLDYACLYGGVVAADTEAVTLCAAYRLAPEHPYPAALDDALAAYEWILDRYPGKPICLIGESAGGGLCYALALKLKELKFPLPAGIVALSPWTDLTLSGRSHLENKEADPSLTTEKLAIFARDYCGQEDPASPCVSPLLGDLRGLPESLIFVGGDEILLDDAVRMASALQKAGCAVHLTVAPDMWHAYILYGLEARKEDAEMIRDFLRSKLS